MTKAAKRKYIPAHYRPHFGHPYSQEVIARVLPVRTDPSKIDYAKCLMDAAMIVGALRAAGFEIVEVRNKRTVLCFEGEEYEFK